jgi:hypothetical protein
MKSTKPVIVLPGQLYLDEEKNRYLIVSARNGETITYRGHGFIGMLEDSVFIDRFLPVDPVDVSAEELISLVDLTGLPVTPKVGFIKD